MPRTVLAALAALSCSVYAQDSVTLSKDLTLDAVLKKLDARTPAVVKIAEADAEIARQYRLPPSLVGHKLSLNNVRGALDFLFGKGWEGSPLREELRDSSNFMLARCPYRPDWRADLWVCNNSCWDWRWEKTKDGPAGGVIHVRRAVQADGDVVETGAFPLPKMKPEFALNTLLQMIKQKARRIVNIDGNQYVPVKDAARPDAQPRLEPMRVSSIPEGLRARLAEPHTIGEYLTILAAGLNTHAKPNAGLWKWSSHLVRSDDGADRVIYTLRDYGQR